MHTTPQQPQKSEKGQSLVELAFSLIILLYLLLGAVEFSMALFQYVTIRDAAQEGAVYASTNPDETDQIKLRAIAAASDVVPLVTSDITITTNNGNLCEGMVSGSPNTLTVTIVYTHNIFLPMVPQMIGQNTIPIAASVTNTILSPVC